MSRKPSVHILLVMENHTFMPVLFPEFLQAWIYLPHYIQSPLFSSFSSNTFLTILILRGLSGLPICGKLRESHNGLSPHQLF